MKILKWFIYSFICIYLFVFIDSNITNFFHYGEPRAKLSSVKANAHTFQTVLETYAVDYGGHYDEFQIVKLEAEKKGYWKDFKNPFDYKAKAIIDLQNSITINELTGRVELQNFNAGTVLYDSVIENNFVAKYYLYGVSKEDNKLIVDKGQVFYLSNN